MIYNLQVGVLRMRCPICCLRAEPLSAKRSQWPSINRPPPDRPPCLYRKTPFNWSPHHGGLKKTILDLLVGFNICNISQELLCLTSQRKLVPEACEAKWCLTDTQVDVSTKTLRRPDDNASENTCFRTCMNYPSATSLV